MVTPRPYPSGLRPQPAHKLAPLTVTVCIPAYEAAEFIERTLGCAREQTYSDQRILVSIDLSEDATEEICRAHAAEDSRVEVVAHGERLGWSGNVNFLLGEVESEFAFLYFHDDLIEPTYNERLVGALRERPDAASAHCDVGHFGGSEKVISGRGFEGPAWQRLFEFLTALRRPSLLRSMLRTDLVGDLRLPAGARGIWANQPFLSQMVAAGPVLHVPEVLYRRWEQREGGLTEGWRKLPFEQIVAGYRANAEGALETIDGLGPSAEERELLLFALFLYLTARLRRAEALYGAGEVHPPELLHPEFAGMAVPAAVERLDDELRERCMRAWDRLQRRTGKLALEVGDEAAAIAAYEDLAARHPENPAFWRNLAKGLRAAGRAEEADEAKQRGRRLRRERDAA